MWDQPSKFARLFFGGGIVEVAIAIADNLAILAHSGSNQATMMCWQPWAIYRAEQPLNLQPPKSKTNSKNNECEILYSRVLFFSVVTGGVSQEYHVFACWAKSFRRFGSSNAGAVGGSSDHWQHLTTWEVWQVDNAYMDKQPTKGYLRLLSQQRISVTIVVRRTLQCQSNIQTSGWGDIADSSGMIAIANFQGIRGLNDSIILGKSNS